MGAVQLACSSLTFNRDPLAKACAGVRELGFTGIDIGVFDQPGLGHLRPAEAAAHMLEVEERLRSTAADAGVAIAALTADADDPDPQVSRQRMASICLLAHRLGARVLSVVVGPATLEQAVGNLVPLYEVAARYGVRLAVETVSGTLSGGPRAVGELLGRVPGLRLTLDIAHAVVQGQTPEDWRHLMASVSHVHLRDAGAGNLKKLQVPWGTGGVNLPAWLAALDAGDYEGWITVEYVDPALLPGTIKDPRAEAGRARAALLGALGGAP